MTIEVEIKNHDAALSIEVLTMELNRDTGVRKPDFSTEIHPGSSQRFYVYHLRDLLVREVMPTPQAKP